MLHVANWYSKGRVTWRCAVDENTSTTDIYSRCGHGKETMWLCYAYGKKEQAIQTALLIELTLSTSLPTSHTISIFQNLSAHRKLHLTNLTYLPVCATSWWVFQKTATVAVFFLLEVKKNSSGPGGEVVMLSCVVFNGNAQSCCQALRHINPNLHQTGFHNALPCQSVVRSSQWNVLAE